MAQQSIHLDCLSITERTLNDHSDLSKKNRYLFGSCTVNDNIWSLKRANTFAFMNEFHNLVVLVKTEI